MEPDDRTDWTEQSGKTPAARIRTAAGRQLGPAGVTGGAIGGSPFEPSTSLLQRIRQAVERGDQKVLSIAGRAAGLSPKELFGRISEDRELQVLTVKAIETATRTGWEHKVSASGRSLAYGLLCSDQAEVRGEQLIMAAIADIEVPHLSLLDLAVHWCPPRTGGTIIRLDIPEYSHSQSANREWSVGERKWNIDAIQTYRPRLVPVFNDLVGVLQRHGLIVYKSKVDPYAAGNESHNLEFQQPYAEPTELGEHVWLCFYG